MVELNHIQQEIDGYNWTCGSTCLEMVLSYYEIYCDKNEIWNSVKFPRKNCKDQYFSLTHRLAKYAISKDLSATIYQSTSAKCSKMLDVINSEKRPAILSIQELKSAQSHFVVYLGSDSGKYHICDPNSPNNIDLYNYETLKDAWSPRPEIDVTGYVCIVFGSKRRDQLCVQCGKTFPVVDEAILEFSASLICPFCDCATNRKRM